MDAKLIELIRSKFQKFASTSFLLYQVQSPIFILKMFVEVVMSIKYGDVSGPLRLPHCCTLPPYVTFLYSFNCCGIFMPGRYEFTNLPSIFLGRMPHLPGNKR